jgi:single-stranded-DNA-specific exonuclease
MKRWTVERPDLQIVEALTKQVGISTVQAKILAARGITDPIEAENFLYMTESAMHDPFLFHDMDKAVKLIKQAIAADKKIVVYGDYDADGVTSVTVLTTALERLGADVFFAIPDRFEHGYGPNKDLFQEFYAQGASLIITVDNGIAGVDEIAFAKTLGLQVIVTDHHEIGEMLPAADAIIHPRHPEGNYPFGELAGVGVAFKLASALLEGTPQDLIELVAIGTVADLVPLQGENRYFVKEGIRRMRISKRPAIQALTKISGTDQRTLDEESLGFMIGPRLNAAGRLGDASPAVHLLKSENMEQALALATELDELNKERQALVSAIHQETEDIIATMYGPDIPLVFVIAAEGWNAGVIGIVASRITDKYHRPTIVLSIDEEKGIAKGSARSIPGFDLFAELSQCAQLLTHFGGHQMAAGMSLEVSNIDLLRKQLNAQAEEILIDDMLSPELLIDVPLTIDEIDVDVLESLELLRPFGISFEKPNYLLEDLSVKSFRKIGATKNHLKLELVDGEQSLDAIGFGIGHIADELTPAITLSVAGDLQVNEWNGLKKPQLMIGDIRSDEWQLFDLRGVREPSRWLPSIPVDHTSFVAFHERTVKQFQSSLKGIAIDIYGRRPVTEVKNLVLLDIPESEKDLQQLVLATAPERIYAHFHAPESVYFDGLPNREQFGWYYSFLKKRGTFDLSKNGELLSKHKDWKKDSVIFMSKVFSELGFVKIEDGFVSIVETIEKRDLSEAPSYQARARQMELEKNLLYTPHLELKSWFDTVLKGTVDREEHQWI